MKIYVPDTENYHCFVVQSEGVVRAYERVPQRNTTVNYRDYYVNSHYLYRDGSQSFGNTSVIPTCLSDVTNEVYYRNDFPGIMIIFTCLCIFCYLIPWKIFCRLFRRFN